MASRKLLICVLGMSPDWLLIDQFWYFKIQPKTIDLNTRLWGITTVGFILRALYWGLLFKAEF